MDMTPISIYRHHNNSWHLSGTVKNRSLDNLIFESNIKEDFHNHVAQFKLYQQYKLHHPKQDIVPHQSHVIFQMPKDCGGKLLIDIVAYLENYDVYELNLSDNTEENLQRLIQDIPEYSIITVHLDTALPRLMNLLSWNLNDNIIKCIICDTDVELPSDIIYPRYIDQIFYENEVDEAVIHKMYKHFYPTQLEYLESFTQDLYNVIQHYNITHRDLWNLFITSNDAKLLDLDRFESFMKCIKSEDVEECLLDSLDEKMDYYHTEFEHHHDNDLDAFKNDLEEFRNTVKSYKRKRDEEDDEDVSQQESDSQSEDETEHKQKRVCVSHPDEDQSDDQSADQSVSSDDTLEKSFWSIC